MTCSTQMKMCDAIEMCTTSEEEAAPSIERGESGRRTQTSREEEKMSNEIESRTVRRWKLLTVAVLLLSTIGVALTVYFYTSNGEIRDFEKQFHDDANKVLGDLGTKVDFSLTAIDALVVSMVVSNKASPKYFAVQNSSQWSLLMLCHLFYILYDVSSL